MCRDVPECVERWNVCLYGYKSVGLNNLCPCCFFYLAPVRMCICTLRTCMRACACLHARACACIYKVTCVFSLCVHTQLTIIKELSVIKLCMDIVWQSEFGRVNLAE